MDFETIVVGGGIAGMSCALKLKENGRDVAIVTDELGGRVCYEPELNSNFGAVFYMENYTNTQKLLKEKSLMAVKLGDLMLHSSKTKAFKGNSPTMIKSMPQMIKFQNFMKNEFMPEYAIYKKDCETMQVIDALEKHPTIKGYFFTKASDLIESLGIDRICDNFVSKFAYACTGSKVSELNALDFLNVTQGAIIPIYDFTFDRKAFADKLDGKVILDTIVKIEKSDGGWAVLGKEGTHYTCKNLVVATTGLVTQKLLDTKDVRQPTRLLSYLIAGKPHPEIAKAASHYFGDTFDIIAINARHDSLFNVFSRKEIDMGQYFDDYEIIYFRDWPEALFTYGDQLQKQDWDENLWIAGDINGLGLEPAAISGVYAANRILGSE
jgi:hypothetical protein